MFPLKLGIKYTVFEKDLALNQRPRDWNFGVYWAQAPFEECLPKEVIDNLSTAFVDPSRKASPDDHLQMLNGKTGEVLLNMPTPNVYRLNRSRFKALTSQNLDIEVSTPLKEALPLIERSKLTSPCPSARKTAYDYRPIQ